MAQSHAHDDHHDHDAHSPQHYVKIYGILLVLLAISIAGPEISPHLGAAGLWVMLFTAFGIAFVKAWLVIKHFMHLTVEKPIVWYILITCLVFIVLFFAGVAPDVKNHEGTNWVNYAAKAEIERALAEHAAAQIEVDPDAEPVEPTPAPVVAAVEKPKTFADMASDAQKKSWLMKRGAEVYTEADCIICHRSNGAGHGPYPPLVGQAEHMGDCTTTKNIITQGMAQPIEIAGVVYDLPMPPTTGLSAEDVAAVATYVRNAWGNDYGVCTP